MKKGEEQARSLFGISLTDRPKWQQFLICSSGFFFGYLVNGICEECVQSLEIQIRMVLHIRARVCVRGGWSWPAGIGDSEGAPERAAGRGSPLRGNCHVGWPDEVPEVLEKEDEHQVLPRPHPLPCPFQDPLEDHQRVGKHLRALTKHPHKKIQVAASDLINFWKNVVIEETGDKKNGNSQSSSKFEVKSERVEAVKVEKVTEAGPIRVNTVSKLENIKVERLSSENGIKTEGIAKKTERVKIKKSEADCPPKLSSVVKCNDPVRDKLREILAEAFSRVYKETSESERDEVKNILDEVDACDPHRVAVIVESAMYKKLGSSTGSHKLKYRSVMFNLKDSKNPDFRRRVLLGHVKAEKLVDLTPEDMASDERKVAKKQIKDKALFECERAGAPKATTDQFKCGRCGQRKCTYHQMQTRSADEPMTTFVTCVNCNNHWKFC